MRDEHLKNILFSFGIIVRLFLLHYNTKSSTFKVFGNIDITRIAQKTEKGYAGNAYPYICYFAR